MEPVWEKTADAAPAKAHAATMTMRSGEKIEGLDPSMRNPLESFECCAGLGRRGPSGGEPAYPRAAELMSSHRTGQRARRCGALPFMRQGRHGYAAKPITTLPNAAEVIEKAGIKAQ
jgi:hypothetical protein